MKCSNSSKSLNWLKQSHMGLNLVNVKMNVASSIFLTLFIAFGMMGGLAIFSHQNTKSLRATELNMALLAPETEQGLFDLMINEFMASNSGSAVDPVDMSSNEDWIELYNPTDEAINLQGMYISDTLADPIKHQITVTLFIQPQSYLLFWADDEPEQGPTHLPFKLKAGGEAIALYAPNGTTEIDAYIFGVQTENVSEGRKSDGGTAWIKYVTATPGRSNIVVPEISKIANLPTVPNPQQPVVVSAVITDDVAISGATLFYSTTNVSTFRITPLVSIPMTLGSNNTYRAQLPGMADNTLVSYYIEATDQLGNIGVGPKNAPRITRKYLVGYEVPQVRINEVMPKNESTLEDPQEPLEFPDWIELYNYGNFSVSLNGLHFSDDPDEPDKYAIPSGLIMLPKTYLIFFADDDGTQGPLHTNFKLNDSDVSLGLYGPFGAVPIDVVTVGDQPSDTSVGRFPDGVGLFGQNRICVTPESRNRLCSKSLFLPYTVR